MNRLRHARWILLVAVVGLWLVPGCGGGGSGSPTTPPAPGPPPPPPPPPVGVFFTANATPGPETIHLVGTDTDNLDDRFSLEVHANEVTDLYGVSFDLRFPGDLLTQRKNATTEGTFLSEDGEVETQLLIRREDGNLIVGFSRVGDVGAVSGSGLLFTLVFANEGAAGAGEFRFRSRDALDATGAVKPDTKWVAGAVEVKI